jgi:hypothetical protein
MPSLLKKIRDIDRLLRKHGPNIELEKQKSEIEDQKKQKEQNEKERKLSTKYHMVNYVSIIKNFILNHY